MAEGSFISDFLKLAAKELDLPAKAILDIPNEDDWSFIIKITAVIERSWGYLVTNGIEDEPIRELILRLPLEGKTNLAFDRHLIDDVTRNKFKFIARLRNRAAHHFLFGFEELFKDPDILNSYKSNFMDVWVDGAEFGGHKIDNKKFIVENPKLTLFIDVLSRLSITNLEVESQKLKKHGDQILSFAKAFNTFRVG
jgi:hypothetical protein